MNCTSDSRWARWARRLTAMLLMVALPTAQAAQTITYFHNDIAGTPVMATDESGALLWKENYLPYGERMIKSPAAAQNGIAYAGRPFEPSTGLSYNGARYYNPQLGRFMAVDSVGVVPENLHSFNRYAYGNNNPYRYVDPNGRIAMPVVVVGTAFFASAAVTYYANCEGCQKSVAAVGGFFTGAYDGARGMWNAVFEEGDEGSDSDNDSGNGGGEDTGRTPAPALPGDPYSKGEVDRRRSELRHWLGAPSLDPDSPIPEPGPGRDQGGHDARGRTPHETGERNVNRNEEHSIRAKGNSSGIPRR